MTAPAMARRWREPAAGAALVAAVRDHVGHVRRVAPLGAVLLTALVVHAGIVPHLAVGAAAPDALLVGVVAVAATRGSRAGAAFGFGAGLCADLFLATPWGTSALAFTFLGHVLGPSGLAPSAPAALCSPASTCFACRTGRRQPATGKAEAAVHLQETHMEAWAGARSTRRRRRAALRRAFLRRSAVLSFVGVGGGRLGVAVVGTTLGGVPFLDARGLVQIVAVALVSAPFGPAAFAAVGRLGPAPRGGP